VSHAFVRQCVKRWQDWPVTEISESRDDEGVFIQTFVHPGGDLRKLEDQGTQPWIGIAAGRGTLEARLTILSLGYFSQTFFNPSGEEIYAKRHVTDCGSASIHTTASKSSGTWGISRLTRFKNKIFSSCTPWLNRTSIACMADPPVAVRPTS
jgi:hypothetical protein